MAEWTFPHLLGIVHATPTFSFFSSQFVGTWLPRIQYTQSPTSWRGRVNSPWKLAVRLTQWMIHLTVITQWRILTSWRYLEWESWHREGFFWRNHRRRRKRRSRKRGRWRGGECWRWPSDKRSSRCRRSTRKSTTRGPKTTTSNETRLHKGEEERRRVDHSGGWVPLVIP